MKIKKLHIENFRSIKSLDIQLDETTVLIGRNNSGKSAILEAIRIALSRRWGQRGTGFTEDDVHRDDDNSDPRAMPPVKIGFEFEEESNGVWPSDMVAALDDIMILTPEGLNKIVFSITYTWDPVKENFEPAWEFLNQFGIPLPPKRRSVNLFGFYDYIIFKWIGALRNINDEFIARSHDWGGLLRSIKIPLDLENEVKDTLNHLDTKLLIADPKLSQIAEIIGHATEIAIDNSPGSAKVRMLPMNLWDLLNRAGLVLRNEELLPWLPLDHHGQGLQSLAVIFLLQASVLQQLSESLFEGAESIFAIEEPEAHLHPQAVRTLRKRIEELPGQKIISTHSPYFVQYVSLSNLRIVRLKNGSTEVSFLPKQILSELPWTEEIQNLVNGRGWSYFSKASPSGNIATSESFEESTAGELINCLSPILSLENATDKINSFRHNARILFSKDDENELTILGKRIRGEIFFARYWIMVEGSSEYLLLHALGRSMNYDLDQHGIAVIDFQNNGNASVYPVLADAFDIPWQMITDGDAESKKFRIQILKRGFTDDDLSKHFTTLPKLHDLEDQLLADGHEKLLRSIMREFCDNTIMTCSIKLFKKRLKKKKTAYMVRLAQMVATDSVLAAKMPIIFTSLIENLKNGLL